MDRFSWAITISASAPLVRADDFFERIEVRTASPAALRLGGMHRWNIACATAPGNHGPNIWSQYRQTTNVRNPWQMRLRTAFLLGRYLIDDGSDSIVQVFEK